jgi:hypothetical protein
MPVLSSTGSPPATMSSISSAVVTSPDATFHAGTPIQRSISTASREKGELRNAVLRARACSARPAHWSSVKPVRCQYS